MVMMVIWMCALELLKPSIASKKTVVENGNARFVRPINGRNYKWVTGVKFTHPETSAVISPYQKKTGFQWPTLYPRIAMFEKEPHLSNISNYQGVQFPGCKLSKCLRARWFVRSPATIYCSLVRSYQLKTLYVLGSKLPLFP